MLEVSGIHSYYGKAHVLSDLTLSVAAGQVVALLGRNGAGKTTTLKSIMQLVAPRAGSVRFEGRELVGLPPYRVARLGRQPPRPGTPGWSVEALFELFPNLSERRHNRGREMSGGEQQMLSIARTLMGNPRCLLLDEPSEGIAPVIVEQMARAVLKLRDAGLTVLLSEQNLHFAQLVASHAVILESGRGRFAGSLEELRDMPEVRDAYLSV